MAQVLLKAVRREQPDMLLDVAAPSALVAIFERMPEVNDIIPLPFKHGRLDFMMRRRIGHSLRQTHYDIAWVLPNSWKSALLPFFAGVKRRIGWRGEGRYLLLNDLRKLHKTQWPLMAERFLALADLSPDHSACPPNATEPTFQQRYPALLPELVVTDQQRTITGQAVHFQPDDRPLLALCPGAAFGWSKRWLPTYFSAVANHYLKQGFRVAILGSPDDQPIAETIMAATEQQCLNWVGQTTLAEAIDLLSLATVVVTNDSGLMHIATALKRPVVAIYGSSSPAFTPPLGNNVTICYLGIECSPCFARDCPLKHFRCMKELKPQQVITAIDCLYSDKRQSQE